MFQGQTLYFFGEAGIPAGSDWWWQGQGSLLSTLILVADSPEAPFGDSEASTLEKLVTAIRQTRDNTAVLKVSSDNLSLPALLNEYRPKYVLLFGLQAADMRLHLQPIQNVPLVWAGNTILQTDSLILLDKEPARKRALWAVLQSMYL